MATAIEEPLTKEEVWEKTNHGTEYLTVVISVDLYEVACSSDRGDLGGLNAIADAAIGHTLSDLKFTPVDVDGCHVLIECEGDPIDTIENIIESNDKPS